MFGEFRLSYRECRDLLTRRLSEPAPGRIQLLSGPRQVGKTTMLLELAERLGPAALYAAGDSPEVNPPGFWERFWARAERIRTIEWRDFLLYGPGAARAP
jgi:predicted AAA+ superfamily ATPase